MPRHCPSEGCLSVASGNGGEKLQKYKRPMNTEILASTILAVRYESQSSELRYKVVPPSKKKKKQCVHLSPDEDLEYIINECPSTVVNGGTFTIAVSLPVDQFKFDLQILISVGIYSAELVVTSCTFLVHREDGGTDVDR